MINKLKVATLNVRGLNENIKRNVLFTWALEENISVLCLQETFLTDDSVGKFDNDWEGTVYHSLSNSTHSRGVSILLNPKLSVQIIDIKRDNDGRKIMLNIELGDEKYTVISVYAPNNESNKIKFFKRTTKWINQNCTNNGHRILCGDFNSTIKPIDRKSGLFDRTSKHFQNLINTCDVVDSYRYKYPNRKKYSYTSKDMSKASRIDYILTSDTLCIKMKKTYMKNVPKIPDHKAIILEFNVNKIHGKGYFKLNTKWLSNRMYQAGIRNTIQSCIEEFSNLVDKRQLWDICKLKIKEFSIKFAIEYNKHQNINIKRLRSDIEYIEGMVTISRITEEDKELQEREDQIYIDKVKGAQIRSRSIWIEEGKNEKFYKILETKNQTNNSITQLYNSQGERVDKMEDIMKVTRDFYSQLYTSSNIDQRKMDEYLSKINLPYKLSNTDKTLCEGKITIEECENVIKHLRKNKSPGHDGLPSEFYNTFWNDIKTMLLDSMQKSFNKNELCASHRETVLTIIFKKGDRLLLKNYRPISLSNVDYKILAFVLANKLHKILDKIISPEQTAYVKKRFIGENIRMIEDVIEYTRKKNIPGLLLFLDFEKAFDTIEWQFIFKCLEKFGFGPDFIRWIKIIYSNPFAMAKINGYLSSKINIYRGIRQGCPLSALLFIICIEVMILAIKQNNNIKGIEIKGKRGVSLHYKISQYADDGSLYLKDINDMINALDEVMSFSSIAVPKLNIEKTEGMWIGSKSGSDEKFGNVNWRNQPIRYLGIYTGTNKQDCERMN